MPGRVRQPSPSTTRPESYGDEDWAAALPTPGDGGPRDLTPMIFPNRRLAFKDEDERCPADRRKTTGGRQVGYLRAICGLRAGAPPTRRARARSATGDVVRGMIHAGGHATAVHTMYRWRLLIAMAEMAIACGHRLAAACRTGIDSASCYWFAIGQAR